MGSPPEQSSQASPSAQPVTPRTLWIQPTPGKQVWNRGGPVPPSSEAVPGPCPGLPVLCPSICVLSSGTLFQRKGQWAGQAACTMELWGVL